MAVKDWPVVKDPVDTALGCIGAVAVWLVVVLLAYAILEMVLEACR